MKKTIAGLALAFLTAAGGNIFASSPYGGPSAQGNVRGGITMSRGGGRPTDAFGPPDFRRVDRDELRVMEQRCRLRERKSAIYVEPSNGGGNREKYDVWCVNTPRYRR